MRPGINILLFIVLVPYNGFAQVDSLISKLEKNEYISIPRSEEQFLKMWNIGCSNCSDSLIAQRYKESTDYLFYFMCEEMTLDSVMKLTQHSSPIIIAYAGMALVHKSPKVLINLIPKILEKDHFVGYKAGCVVLTYSPAFVAYLEFDRRFNDSSADIINLKRTLDSILLVHPKINWLELGLVLNRLDSNNTCIPAVEYAAFTNHKPQALSYLQKKDRVKYKARLGPTYISILSSVSPYELGEVITNIIELEDTYYLNQLSEWLELNRDKWQEDRTIIQLIEGCEFLTNKLSE